MMYYGLMDTLMDYEQTQLITSQDIDRLEWCGLHVDCDVFNQLFGLSFWRYPFTAKDPLVSKFKIQRTNSSTSWMAWRWFDFQQIYIFGLTICLKVCAWPKNI